MRRQYLAYGQFGKVPRGRREDDQTTIFDSWQWFGSDHRAAMSPHKWHNEDENVIMNSWVTMCIGPNGLVNQVCSGVTILNSQITMHVDNDNSRSFDNEYSTMITS
eukprot:6485646-Amphidinium_carterae.2